MHWYWIDRYTVFESHRRAEAIKAISLAEDHLHDHFRHHPVMPGSLVLEGLAQTGGLLVCEATGYQAKVVLAKIPKIVFHDTEMVPGDLLTYKASIDSLRDGGAVVTVSAHRGEELLVEGEFVFAHLSTENFKETTLFRNGDLIDMMRVFGAYDIGVAEDGSKLMEP